MTINPPWTTPCIRTGRNLMTMSWLRSFTKRAWLIRSRNRRQHSKIYRSRRVKRIYRIMTTIVFKEKVAKKKMKMAHKMKVTMLRTREKSKRVRADRAVEWSIGSWWKSNGSRLRSSWETMSLRKACFCRRNLKMTLKKQTVGFKHRLTRQKSGPWIKNCTTRWMIEIE